MRGRDWASKLMSAVNDPAIKNVAIVGAVLKPVKYLLKLASM